MISFPLYISVNGRSHHSFFSKMGEQWGFYMLLMLLFLWEFFSLKSFHNDTSVVSISKTVSIDANYLLKLETFLIHFDEGKGTCIRSSEAGQPFLGKRRKKSTVNCGNLLKLFFLVSCHAMKLKVNRLKAKNRRENLSQPG